MNEAAFKQKAQEELGRSLCWHERSYGRRIIDGGFFEERQDPIYTTYFGKDRRSRVSCAGSDGFVDISRFEKQAMCASCQYRTGVLAPLPYARPFNSVWGSGNVDLQDPTYEGLTILKAAVPAGCPHGVDKASEHLAGSVAARLVSLDEKRPSVVPLAWRLSAGSGKLVLSIQYRKIFANTDADIFTTSFLYQSITADLESGQTYVGSVRAAGKAGYGPDMENVTYKCVSSLLREADGFCEGALAVPMRRMLEALPGELAALGWEMPRREIDFAGKSAEGALAEIAQINRFPRAVSAPLGWMAEVLSQSAKPQLSKIPRDATEDQFAGYLGITADRDLDLLLAEDETARAVAYVLTRIGCDDPRALMYACCGGNRDNMAAFFYSIYHAPETFSFDPTSALVLMASHAIGKGGWATWIDSACVSCYGQYDGSEMATQLGYIAMSDLAFPKCKTMPALGKELDHIWNKYAWNQDILPPENDPAAEDLKKLEWSEKIGGRKWSVVYDPAEAKKRATYTRADGYSNRYLRIDCDGEARALALVDLRVRLDGRKWTARRQSEYLALRMLGDAKDEKQKAREEELDRILAKSFLFSFALRSADELAHSESQYELAPDTAKVVVRWCDERKIALYRPALNLMASKIEFFKNAHKN